MYRAFLLAIIVPLSATAALLVAVALGWVDADQLRFSWNTLMQPPNIGELNAVPGRPGTPMAFELIEAPAQAYGPQDRDEADRPFIGPIQSRGFCYSPALGRAAREVAAFYRRHRRLAPSGALAFILDSSGASFWGTRQALVVTTFPGSRALNLLLDDIESMPDGTMCVGMAETQLSDGFSAARVIVALSAKHNIILDRTPRSPRPSNNFVIKGRFLEDFTQPRFVAMGPKQKMIRGKLRLAGRRFELNLPLTEGRWWIELIANGPTGPAPLSQLSMYAGVVAPTSYLGIWPLSESALTHPESYMAKLVNEDRETMAIPPLTRDGHLDLIAASHSKEMSELGYVGHHSPKTGDVADRLLNAGYTAVRHGENVALNGNLGDAQAALMQSLGHRQNILSPDFTHFGIGLAQTDAGWYVTQVFARPTPIIDDLGAAQDAFLAHLNTERKRSKLRALTRSDFLGQLADKIMDAGPSEATSILSSARSPGEPKELVAVSLDLVTLENLPEPAVVSHAGVEQIGVSIQQYTDRKPPNIRVIMVLSKGL